LGRGLSPGSFEHSFLLKHVAQLGPGRMPPLATSELNEEAIALLSQWIKNSMSTLTVAWAPGGAVHLSASGEPGRTDQSVRSHQQSGDVGNGWDDAGTGIGLGVVSGTGR